MRVATLLPTNEKIEINSVFLIGRNYIDDVAERAKAAAGAPVVSLKPTSAIIFEGEQIHLPTFSRQVNFEIELLILIGAGGKNISVSQALGHVLGYGVGLDLTAHDLHQEAKAKGLPWTVSKGFDCAAPLSSFIAADHISEPQGAIFHLEVNGQRRQTGRASDMVFGVTDIIAHLSRIFTLERGDIIYTGTPAGAAPLASGDRLRLDYAGLISAEFQVA